MASQRAGRKGSGEQAAEPSGAGGSAQATNENSLGDIIAQQREFQMQLRQESRLAHRPSQRQMTMNAGMFCGSESCNFVRSSQSPVKTTAFSSNTRPQTKRKFSLSLAMSNLATFASSNQQQRESAQQQLEGAKSRGNSTQQQPQAKPPIRPPRHRDSLATQTMGDDAPPLQAPQPPASLTNADGSSRVIREVSEKKRGLVHKAIRRGSKMFDSMLLSSALRQSQQSTDSQKQQPPTKAKLSVGSRQSSSEGTTSHSARVQFATSRDDDEDDDRPEVSVDGLAAKFKLDGSSNISKVIDDDEAVRQLQLLNSKDEESNYRRRRRKYRLGSIPHDLRRALSLSSNSHKHHSNSSSSNNSEKQHIFLKGNQQQDPTANGRRKKSSGSDNQGQPSSEDQLELGAHEQRQQQNRMPLASVGPTSSSGSSSAAVNGTKLAASFKLSPSGGGPQQPLASSGRLRRKNSLFAPLTNYTTAFYHHHHHHHQHHSQRSSKADQQQHQASPSPISTSGLNQQQANATTNSQSASFSLCQDHNRTYKLIIFGSSAVGKTSLIQRFLYGHFPGEFLIESILAVALSRAFTSPVQFSLVRQPAWQSASTRRPVCDRSSSRVSSGEREGARKLLESQIA